MRQALLVVLACIALASCFTSKEPLIGPGDAAFPYERIDFAEVGQPDNPQTWTHQGDAYVWRPKPDEDGEALVRLKAIGDGLYLVQLEYPGEKGTERLYGVIRADLAAMRVYSYATIKPDAFEPLPGLSLCDSSVCIDDVDAYLGYAKSLIAAGTPPEAEYVILRTE
jgi:hypothetical protein